MVYTLLRNVTYEGSTYLGTFSSIPKLISYLNDLEGYLLDEFTCTDDDLEPFEAEYWEDVVNCVGAWDISAPGDQSFTVYAISLGGE